LMKRSNFWYLPGGPLHPRAQGLKGPSRPSSISIRIKDFLFLNLFLSLLYSNAIPFFPRLNMSANNKTPQHETNLGGEGRGQASGSEGAGRRLVR
jgi:hypothetical protein